MEKYLISTVYGFGKPKSLIMVLLFLVVFVMQSFAQQRKLTGVVSDETSPLSGVNVLIVGSTAGVQTDFDGKYTINANKGDILRFSYVGMKTQTAVIGSSNTLNITMTEDAESLEQIIVVGYGSQKKNDITGAVSSVKASDIAALPIMSAEQALQGRASGVTLINSGSPGSAPIVRIRGIGTYGDNKPVFVVDGVVTDNISDLTADDIESLSVLKDASTTAVFGSLGANGVIVVKTKNGKKGKVKFNFTSYAGIQSAPKSLDVLNSEQYKSYITDLVTNAGGTVPLRLTESQYSNFIKKDTDWQDAIFQNGNLSNYNLSASGGGDNSRFRIGTGYQSQDGVLLNTDLKKYTFRANSEFKMKKFTFGENLSVSFSNQRPLVNANRLSPIENAIRMAPYLDVNNASNLGGFNGPLEIDQNNARNAVRTLTMEKNKTNKTGLLGNIYGSYEILKGLTYKIEAGLNYYNYKNKDVLLPYYEGFYNAKNSTTTNFSDVVLQNLTTRNSLNYNKSFNKKHYLDFLLLAEKDDRQTNLLIASGTSDDLQQIPNNSGTSTSKLFERRRIGYLGRVNYNYMSKYLASFSLRRDGSSRVGKNNRFNNFPAIALGWVISKEDFFNNDGVANYLKLRGSWGKAGNDETAGDYRVNSTLSSSYPYGGSPGIAYTSIKNENLKWETTTMTNVGLDLSFLKNKIILSSEYYNNVSDDLIVNVPAAGSLGVINAIPVNVGGMKTSGFEFNLGVRNKEHKFKWSTNFNISTAKNEVTKLAGNIKELFAGNIDGKFAGNSITRLAEGESMWHFYGWETDGIFQNQAEIDAHPQEDAAPGDIRFKDINNDGIIDNEDRTVIGNAFPNITYGLNFDGSYNNFDFNVFFSGVSGNDIFNATRFYLDGSNIVSNAGTAVLDRWTPTNASTTQPRAVFGDPNKNTRTSNRYIEDGSYLKLKNLSLGYSLNKNILNSIAKGSLSKFRVYVSTQNLLTFTKYSGYDPEIGVTTGATPSGQGANTELGIDRGQYPQTKSFLMGVQLSF